MRPFSSSGWLFLFLINNKLSFFQVHLRFVGGCVVSLSLLLTEISVSLVIKLFSLTLCRCDHFSLPPVFANEGFIGSMMRPFPVGDGFSLVYSEA